MEFVRLKEKNHVDEIMRGMQGASEEASAVRFCPLPVRLGVAGLTK
jgi:hypothetical protein